MPQATQIQRLSALARELAAYNGTDLHTAILGMCLTHWHVELTSIVANVPVAAVREFCAVHLALTNRREPQSDASTTN